MGPDSSRLSRAVLVTGNPGKLEEARRLCGIALEAVHLDLPEIQSLDIRQVLRAKASQAHELLDRSLIVDETGLELRALGGFPGCLVKWMLAAVGPEGIAQTSHALADPRATARCALLFFDGKEEILVEGTTEGRLVLPPRGERGFGWDAIFEPHNLDQTFAELSPREKDRVSHRGAAWRALKDRMGVG